MTAWFGILLFAVLNGGARERWLIPWLGATLGRAVSTVVLCGLVFGLTWLTIGWIRPRTTAAAMSVGLLGLGLTLTFEFLVGHYILKKTWAVLLECRDSSVALK